MIKSAFLIVCLIVGNMIGAGILALPINTGLAGLLPSLLIMLVLGAGMFFSAVVLSGEAIAERTDTFNYPSLYLKYIGPGGKWIAITANMLILYGLLVAYITGAAKIISDILQIPEQRHWVVMVAFFAVVTLSTALRTRLLLVCTAGLVAFKVATFFIMTSIAEAHIHPSHYAFADWHYLPATAAIILTSFHFHNIIPNICREMSWSFSATWKAILLGMAAGYIMNAVWMQVSIGVLPMDSSSNGILTAFHQNLPATVPMSHIISSRLFVISGIIFAMAALTTAYMTNGLGLRCFMHDLLVNHFRLNIRGLDAALTFLPPLIISCVYPNIFLKAIDVVGGFGIVILFGVLPAIIFLKKANTKRGRLLAWMAMALFAACLAVEVMQETGLLLLKPEMEYWSYPIQPSDHKFP